MKATIAVALCVGLIGLAGGVGRSAAEEGKHWYFNVENKSNGTVNEFRTQEDGEWSENWLSSRLEPGDEIKLDFETNEGSCEVRTQIHLIDGSYFDAPVDYCKASTLEIQNNTLVWK